MAKSWKSGAGSGVPTDAIRGFVPDSEAETPPGLCPAAPSEQSGRLWFGQEDAAFDYEPDGVAIGAQATRLFFRANGPDQVEVEPDYRFGRALRWWDRHYQAVADYEPQYHRLEQLMRWSGALEWLTFTGGRALPQPLGSSIRSDLTFADWYAEHTELRERDPLALVTPPSASPEAVLPIPSATFQDCGPLWISGGVSLADGIARRGGLPSDPVSLSPGMRRAWPTDPVTTGVDATGSGRIDRITPITPGQVGERITYDLRRGPDSASVTVEGPPSVAVRFGDDHLQAGNDTRSRTTVVRSDGSNYVIDESVQDAWFGSLEVTRSADGATEVTLLPGLGVLAKGLVDRIRGNPERGLEGAPEVRYQYALSDGPSIVYRVDDGWIEVGPPSPSFRPNLDVVFGAAAVGFRTGAPRSLSQFDVAAFEITQGPTSATYGELLNRAPSSTPMYLDAVAGEPSTVLPGAIAADTPIVWRAARPRTDGATSGGIGGQGTWNLIDPPDRGRGGGGGGDGGGGLGLGTVGVLGGAGAGGVIILVTTCEPERQPQPQECG